MNKVYSKTVAIALLVIAMSMTFASAAHAQDKGEEKKQWTIFIKNIVTGGVPSDTITVDLLRPDSTLILSQPAYVLFDEAGLPSFNMAHFNLPGQDFIVRLSHPDYETAYHKVHIKKDGDDKTLQIRRLTKREKAMMLDEVVVTASIVEFVHKGDTIQFNADAFELAEGSMLSALIKRLPGTELKDNGQILVNGKFVSKLLLNGEDFFKNDKLVLLQNLPAYTVKNIQVYEETLPQQLAKNGSSDPDLVMNVKLKKEFNAGWMANAEAGGGTHNRYRLRGFGIMYNTRSRFAAYGLINNLNETGSPDMSGDWKDKSNQRDEIITKGGGFDYNVKPKQDFTIKGNATVQYQTIFGNTLENQQNYLPDGVNYSRRWLDNRFGNLKVHTDHTAEFNTGDAWHESIAEFDYGSDKMRNNVTEGTFGAMPGDYPDMRPDLQAGMPDTLDILNRYLSLMNTDSKRALGGMSHSVFVNLGKHYISGKAWGNLSHRWQDGVQKYLMQSLAEGTQSTDRVNPQDQHSYKYGAEAEVSLVKGWFRFTPEYRIDNSYNFSSTMLYDLMDGTTDTRNPDPLQQWQRMDYLERVLDARNSYVYGLHNLDQTLTLEFNYTKKDITETGKLTGKFQFIVEPRMRYLSRKMNFNGFDRQILTKNKWMPGVEVWMDWYKNYRNKLQFKYDFSIREPNMMDMLDVSFNSEPLNPTMGNPNLKYGFRHYFDLSYNSQYYLLDKLYLMAGANYTFDQNTVTYTTLYNMATGVRTTMPMNINGNRYGSIYLFGQFKPIRTKNFFLKNQVRFSPSRFATYLSTTTENGMQRSVSHSDFWSEWFCIEYNSQRFTLATTVTYNNEFNTSRTGDFEDYRVQYLDCAVRGLVRLPLNFEISSNISVLNYWGYTDPAFNKAQVIWNARISKSVMGGSLQFAFDGYDMLQQIKKVRYDTTAAYRRETHFNSVPSYFMFSVKYFFAKKPKSN